MKRFWQSAVPVVTGNGFGVSLDGKPVRLPGGAPLAVPSRPLAEAIATEWQDAGKTVMPDDLPLTRLAGTAIERIAPDPEPVRASLLAYGGSDLLCYRAEAPDDLVALQHASWQPWLDWAGDHLGARLRTTSGLAAIDQPSEAIAALARALVAEDCRALAGLGVLVPVLGSLVLGLAVLGGALAPENAHRLSILDETWQEQKWGTDAEVLARRRRVGADIASATRFATLARS